MKLREQLARRGVPMEVLSTLGDAQLSALHQRSLNRGARGALQRTTERIMRIVSV